jgi:hypothetical protein
VEANIIKAIAALKAALEAGDIAEEAMYPKTNECNWRTTAAEIEKCLDYLTSKSSADIAAETWGVPTGT